VGKSRQIRDTTNQMKNQAAEYQDNENYGNPDYARQRGGPSKENIERMPALFCDQAFYLGIK
jgi:hypothetical protein